MSALGPRLSGAQMITLAQHGITHGFVAEFESPEDRDYYVSSDPVHLGLGSELHPLVDQVIVVDFTDHVL